MLSCGGLSIIAGCANPGTSGVAVSIDNKDSEAHSVAMEIQRQSGETLFERTVNLTAGESQTFDNALSSPSEKKTFVAHVALDVTSSTHEFELGGRAKTGELVVNIKQDGELEIFVTQP